MKDIGKFSKIGYGCYSFTGVYGKKLSEMEMEKIIKKGYELGITFFDTSSSYKNTEEILGKTVKTFRKDIVLSTKISVNSCGKIDLSYQSVITSCEESLRKLKTDYIDILHVHYNDPVTPIEETILALEKLKESGKILSYGVGHLPLNILERYLEFGNISTVMAEVNPLSYKKLMDLNTLQEKYSFAIIAFSITGRGLLTGKITSSTVFSDDDIRKIDPLFRNKKLEFGLKIAKKLEKIGIKYGLTPVQVAINWTLENKGVISGLTGTTNLQHLMENIEGLRIKLEQRCIEEISNYIAEQQEILNKHLEDDVDRILYKKIHTYLEGKSDLIYLLEYFIEKEVISTDIVMNLFMEIMSLDREEKPLVKLETIKCQLREIWEKRG